MKKNTITPDYLFEVSWEVCNKIGGIHTVISTKAISAMKTMNDNYIVIGPDVYRDSDEHPEFVEDDTLFGDWTTHAESQGLIIRTGRWKIEGSPIAVIVDFTPFFSQKDEIFSRLWELYKLDSLQGQWDYVEPTLFGYATGKAIENFIQYHGLGTKKVVAHFHEWMTGAGLLYLTHAQPQVGTIFTTHATAVGRSLAGNYQPLYSEMHHYNGDEKAKELNIVAKQSLEKTTARHADVFTTVSELTGAECAQFHGKEVDLLTPNGFEDSFVPKGSAFDSKRESSRGKLIEVASRVTGQDIPPDAFLIATSGRYEFKNKGLDIFIDALGNLNKKIQCEKQVVAFILVPANHYGPRKDLVAALEDPARKTEAERYLTHYLHYAEHDQVLKRIAANQLNNSGSDRVKVIFVPSYLKGDDGIFNMDYYDTLIGFDLTVFPSYYEPWGYTPLESLAFSIPSVTTTLTGFGRWVNNEIENTGRGITVIPRDDHNDDQVADAVSGAVLEVCKLDEKGINNARLEAYDISRIALWEKLISHYWEAYSLALERSQDHAAPYIARERVEQLPETEKLLTETRPTWRKVIVQQNIPESLKPLEQLAKNLWWSWNQDAIDLFAGIDPKLWIEVDENPIELLDRIPYDNLIRLQKNKTFTDQLDAVYNRFRDYMETPPRKDEPTVSYFSMEFGLHNSLKIYSGGLGLLAGDYLKEASDYNYSMVGVGLLYKYGYFQQVISSNGDQVAYDDTLDFSRLPVVPIRDDDGKWKTVQVVLPGRTITARIWRTQVGRVPLYLLDADIDANKPHDREVTHKLYGGDHENRFKQELLLGIGGIRALRAIGIDTDIYHCNEGHAAFIGLERLREYIQDRNMTFPEAVEVVRASSLFTTHTPVPAGHDSFDENIMRTYMSHYPERLNISWNRFMNLGRYHPNNSHEKFSMSVLAVNLSQEVNGVSKLHGRVSQEMFSGMYNGYMTDEMHIGYVTNGVHVPTWLSASWRDFYEKKFGADFLQNQDDRKRWTRINDVPDEEVWSIKSRERAELIDYIRDRLSNASARKLENPKQLVDIAGSINKDALTIGFARRFATYKRAHLLFRDLERLAKIVNNTDRPVQFLFAGKAHPNDIPGQDLIKMIVGISKRPEFTGKVIFLQNYNIHLAKHLLHGVDIWLNTPTRPLEASGTSGEKSVMNGGIHFSVLDGWWAEGYREGAGYALPLERTFDNQDLQDELDSERIYSILENEIIPRFYSRDKQGVPGEWVKVIKKSIAEVAPEFTMNRMLIDYINRFYSRLYKRSLRLRQNDYRLTREISYYKKQIIDQWKNIQVIAYDIPDPNKEDFRVGETYTGKVTLELNGLSPDEIGVEMVMIDANTTSPHPKLLGTLDFVCTGQEGSTAEYTFVQQVGVTGEFNVGFRIYPKMDEIPHRMDFPLVRWI